MLKCRDIVQQSGEYLDTTLSPWQRVQFAMHLFICVHCRRYVQHLKLTIAFMRKRGMPAESRDIDAVVSAAMRPDSPR